MSYRDHGIVAKITVGDKHMSYGRQLYHNLCEVVEQSENFFMNVHEYKDHRIVMFDYSLTIPNDFGVGEALEARGSCFEIDEHGNFVSIVALPFEKFFNVHEYDYDSNHDLKETFKQRYGIECDSETVMSLCNDPETIIMDKRDGSIITFFTLDSELDCKSNSSLTSDYKFEALNILKNSQPELYDRIKNICSEGYSVCTEYTSKNPYRQIVLPYQEDLIVVTGVRSHVDGSYMPYQTMIDVFGTDNVVESYSKNIDLSVYDESDIEGYVVWHQPTGLHFKLKTKWYLERHRIKAAILTPSNVWELYINGDIDDVGASVPESNKSIFEYFMQESEHLYNEIVHMGISLYEQHKHLDRKDFFNNAIIDDEKYKIAGVLARHLYNGCSVSEALDKIRHNLLIKRNISSMGIPKWSYDDRI